MERVWRVGKIVAWRKVADGLHERFPSKLTRARILLLAHESKTDEEIATAPHVRRVTVERTSFNT